MPRPPYVDVKENGTPIPVDIKLRVRRRNEDIIVVLGQISKQLDYIAQQLEHRR